MTAYSPRHASDVPAGEPQPTVFTPLAQFFRRVMRLPRRKPAVPAAIAAAGTATALLTPPDGSPVLGDRMISEVRAEHDALTAAEPAALRPRKTLPREDGEIVIDERNRVHVRPVNGRSLGTLPRRKPMVNRQPWQTAEMPVYGQKPQLTVDATRNGWQ